MDVQDLIFTGSKEAPKLQESGSERSSGFVKELTLAESRSENAAPSDEGPVQRGSEPEREKLEVSKEDEAQVAGHGTAQEGEAAPLPDDRETVELSEPLNDSGNLQATTLYGEINSEEEGVSGAKTAFSGDLHDIPDEGIAGLPNQGTEGGALLQSGKSASLVDDGEALAVKPGNKGLNSAAEVPEDNQTGTSQDADSLIEKAASEVKSSSANAALAKELESNEKGSANKNVTAEVELPEGKIALKTGADGNGLENGDKKGAHNGPMAEAAIKDGVEGKSSASRTEQFSLKTVNESPSGVKEADRSMEVARLKLDASRGEVRMNLNTLTLGKLKVELSMHENQLKAIFHTESQAVKAVLDSNMNNLKDSLAEQKMDLESFDVHADSSGHEREADGDTESGPWHEMVHNASGDEAFNDLDGSGIITNGHGDDSQSARWNGLNIFV